VPYVPGAIYWARISKFTLAISQQTPPKSALTISAIYAEITQPHAEREIPMIQMMREEALAAFRAWEQNPGKIRY